MRKPLSGSLLAWLMLLSLVLAVVTILSVFVYYLYGETPPIVYLNSPFPLEDDDGILHPGEKITLKVKRNNPYDFSRSFIVTRQIECDNGGEFGLESKLHPVGRGTTETDIDSAVIPLTVKTPTVCRVIGNTQVAGRIVTHFVHWKSVDFRVE